MVASSRKEVLPKGKAGDEKKGPASRRNTRGSIAITEDAEHIILPKVTENDRGSIRRRKQVPREANRVVCTSGKQKEKTLSPAVVDVVFGSLQNSVADVDELRRKREEDALKCGHRVRTVGNSFSEMRTLQKSSTVSEQDNSADHVSKDDRPKSKEISPRNKRNGSSTGEFLCIHYTRVFGVLYNC